jgi:uncharacterized protein YceK
MKVTLFVLAVVAAIVLSGCESALVVTECIMKDRTNKPCN